MQGRTQGHTLSPCQQSETCTQTLLATRPRGSSSQAPSFSNYQLRAYDLYTGHLETLGNRQHPNPRVGKREPTGQNL